MLQLLDPAFSQFSTHLSVIRNGLRNQIPKSLGMIHLAQMTEFVHNQVIGQVIGQKNNFIIEA